jgi:CelD/BcsL family acetyltransferase involved in cellulose biosynthesis
MSMFDLADPETLTLVGASGVERVSVKAVTPRVALWRFDRAVAIASDRAAFDALQAEWGELEESAAGATFFQSSAWCRAVYDHHEAHGQDFEPLVVTLRVAGRLVGLLPLQRVSFGMSCIVTGFGEPYQQYTDVLVAADAPADTAARLLNAACRLPKCDGVNLLKVRGDSPLAALLDARNAIKSNEDAAPFVDLTPHPDFKSYLATLNAKTRKNMRNIKNRIARMGTLGHRVWSDPADVRALVERTHAGRERWLEAQGLTSRAFRDKSFGDFGLSLANPESGLQVMAMSLTIDDQPVADQWGFVFNGRYYAYVATWRPEFEEASPGKLHLEEVIRACHERGLAVADFLMPAVRYKFTWTPTAMSVADYALPLSLSARLQFSLWSAHLRPWLKRIALKLPAGLRSRIANLLLRR